MAELKRIPSSGKQNRDFSPYVLPPDQYRSLMNGRIARSEGSDVGALENIRGNSSLSTFADQSAVVIGSIRDQLQDRIYYFIVGATEDGIYEYNSVTDSVREILRSTTQSGVLKFSVDNLITGINLIGEGDERLLLWTDGNNPPRRINIERMVERHQERLDGVVVDTDTGERTVTGFTEEEISVVKAPPLFPPSLSFTELDDLNPDNDDENDLIREQNLREKFVRFAYRYKFVDDEYSPFSPFSDVAFSAGRFTFDNVTGSITSMENLVRAIDISFNTGPRDVVEVDLLYKASDSVSVYIVESFIKSDEEWRNNIDLSPDNTTETPIEFSSNKLYRILPESELLRTSDIVPLKAKAQDIIENRVVYGNYVSRYDLEDLLHTYVLPEDATEHLIDGVPEKAPIVIDLEASVAVNDNKRADLDIDPDLIGEFGERNLKSDRDYEIGIVYTDNVGRSTPVLTSDNSSVHVPVQRANRRNKLQVQINSVAPDWATNYRFYIKNQRETHYNIIPLDVVSQPDDNEFKWFRLSPTDIDKIAVGEYLVLKIAQNEFSYHDPATERRTFRVEELGPQERNFLELETPRVGELRNDETSEVLDAGKEITLQRPGVWMKLRNHPVLGRDIESVQDSSVTVGRTNNAYDLRNRPIVGELDSYQDVTYYYKGTQITNAEVGDDSVTFAGTYVTGTGLGSSPPTNFIASTLEDAFGPTQAAFPRDFVNNQAGAGPMRIEIEIIDENRYEAAYYLSPSFADPVVRRILLNPIGTALPVLVRTTPGDDTTPYVGVTHTLVNGKTITFNEQNTDYNIGDRFTVVDRVKRNFLWRCWDVNERDSSNGPTGTNRKGFDARRAHIMMGIGHVEDGINGGSLLQFGVTDGHNSNNDGTPVSLQFNKNEYYTNQNVFFDNLEEWMFEEGYWTSSGNNKLSGTDRDGNAIGIHQFGFARGLPGTPGEKLSLDDGLRLLGAPAAFYGTAAIAAAVGATSPALGIVAGIAAAGLLPFAIGALAVVGLISIFAGGRDTSSDFRLLSGPSMRLLGGQREGTTFSITEDSNPFPLYMFVQSGVRNGSSRRKNPNRRMYSELAFVQGTGASENDLSTVPIAFETIPLESNLDIYYEIGDTFKCENGIHYSNDPNNNQRIQTVPISEAGVETGFVERSASVTLDYFNCIAFKNGVESMTIRDEFGVAELDRGAKASIVIDEFEEVNNFATLIYSGPHNASTGINRLNVFSSADVGNRSIIKEMDESYGSIQKVYAENTDLIVFQEDKVSRVQVDKNALFNADGSSNVAASTRFLNQTIPYVGEFGISKNPESFAVYGNSKFFSDRVRGVILELSQAGLNEISNYGMRDFFRDNLAENELVIGSYDDYHDQYIVTLCEPFVDPAISQTNVPLVLSRQGFLSRNDACRFPANKLQFRQVYEFWTIDEIQGFQVGDIIYQDLERTSIFNGSDDWFISIKDTEDRITSLGVPQNNQVIFEFPDRRFDDVLMLEQRVTAQSRTDSSMSYEGELVVISDISIAIQFDDDVVFLAEDALEGAEFDLEITFEYVLNIDSFGVVRRILNCLTVPPLNHDAFRISLNGYPSAGEACGSGIVGRILYHNGDDATPDNGDSIYDTPYGDDEFIDVFLTWREDFTYEIGTRIVWKDRVWEALRQVLAGVEPTEDATDDWMLTDLPVQYTQGRTQRRGWYQIFDGDEFEDYVIRILQGRVVDKIRCAAIRAGRTVILHGNNVTRRSTETDDAFAARVCRTIPGNEAFHDGDALIPVIGDIMFINDFTADTFSSGNYAITGGSYITINNDDGVISNVRVCIIRECLRDVINTYGNGDGIMNAQQQANDNAFTFRGQVDELIFGNTEKQAANQVTIRWSAKGAERYPANPNDFYELVFPNGLVPDEVVTLTNTQFATDISGETNLEYNIFEFCHNKTLVPQTIRVRYIQADPDEVLPAGSYPGVDAAPFLARIFDLTGNTGTGTVEVNDEIYFDITAITTQYFIDDSLQTPFNGTVGRLDDLLDSVIIDGVERFGLWWAFGDTDNAAAEVGLLIDNMGYVLAERPRDFPFEVPLKFHTDSVLLACTQDDATFRNYYTNNDDFTMVTDFVNLDETTPISGYYVWENNGETPDDTTDDQQQARLWDKITKTFTAIDGDLTVDNCPISLPFITVTRYTSERNMACNSGGISTRLYTTDTFSAGTDRDLFNDEFGTIRTNYIFLRSGTTRLIYNTSLRTLTTSNDSCPLPVCTDSNANNQGSLLPCTYNPYCGDANANNQEFNTGRRPRLDRVACEYTNFVATLDTSRVAILGPTDGYTIIQTISSTGRNNERWALSWEFRLTPGYVFTQGTSQPASYNDTNLFDNANVTRSISRVATVALAVIVLPDGCAVAGSANFLVGSNNEVACTTAVPIYFQASSDIAVCNLGTGATNALIYSAVIEGVTTYFATPDPAGPFAASGWYSTTGTPGGSAFRLGTGGTPTQTAACTSPAPPITGLTLVRPSNQAQLIVGIGSRYTLRYTGGTPMFGGTQTPSYSISGSSGVTFGTGAFNAAGGSSSLSGNFFGTFGQVLSFGAHTPRSGTFTISATIVDGRGLTRSVSSSFTPSSTTF